MNPSNTAKEALRDEIIGHLKHAYYSARTDELALKNQVIPDLQHAIPVINNKADEIIAAIAALIAGCVPEKKDTRENQNGYDKWQRDAEVKGFNNAIDTITANLKAKGLL